MPGMKAGEEKYVEPTVVFQDERYVVFVESEKISDELRDQCVRVIECVRNLTKDIKASRGGNARGNRVDNQQQ